MYNLFKWLDCLVVKDTVMCQKGIIFFVWFNENIKVICLNKSCFYYVFGFVFLFKKRLLKCIKWFEYDGDIKVNVFLYGNNSVFNVNLRVKFVNDFIVLFWLV